ncbi:MAG: metallophosphoesterase family protein [Prochlorotrichaceae cyanobacterium]|jgi:3',5'-cyclic AMP phosphodiesterase CpdA
MEPERFKLAILGDLHFPNYTSSNLEVCRDRVFRDWFRQIAELNPDLVIAVGDTTNWGMIEELTRLRTIVSESNLPFIAIAGNHDCYSLPKAELAPFFLGDYTSVASDQLYCSFDRANIRFILLDTAKPKEARDYGGWLPAEQGEWLREQIRDYNQQPNLKQLLVFGHHPLKETTTRTEEHKLHIENTDFILPILETLERPTGYYFCGHNHQHSIVQKNQWCYVQSAAPWDCLSFRWVTIASEPRLEKTPTPVEIEVRYFQWQDDHSKKDWQIAYQSIPHFTAKTWEFANNNH